MATVVVRRLPPRVAVGAHVLLGLLVAAVTWWLVDEVSLLLQRRLDVGEPAAVPAVLMVVVGLAGSVLIARLPAALLAAGALLVVGIILGLYFPEVLPAPGILQGDTLVVPEGAIDPRMIALRGAHEPAIHVLTGAWVAMGAWGLYRRRSSPQGAN